MRKKREKRKNADAEGRSLFATYMTSYIGLALLSCALIGTMVFGSFVNDFIDLNKTNLRQKMTLAADDLQNQLDVMEGISYTVATSATFWPYNVEDNYSEREMLVDFERFRTYSPIIDEYFMIYLRDVAKVYRSTARTSQTAAVLESLEAQMEAAELTEQIAAVQHLTVIELNAEKILVCCPIRFATAGPNPPGAVIAFVCRRDVIAARVTTVTGGISESYELMMGELIVTNAQALSASPLAAKSKDGDVRMRANDNTDRVLFGLSALQGANVIFFILGLVVLVGFSVLLAFRHFQPIQKLNEQLARARASATSKNELKNIGAAIRGMMADNERINAQLSRQTEQLRVQTELLRSQTIRALLDGSCDERMRERLSLLHIELGERQLAGLLVRFQSALSDKALMTRLIQQIEDLSDGEQDYYCTPQPHDTGIAVIAAMSDDSRTEATEMITELLAAQNVTAAVQFGGVYTDPEQLSLSFMEASETLQRQMDPHSAALLTDRTAVAGELVEFAVRGDQEHVAELIGRLRAVLHRSADSVLLQRYVYADLAGLVDRSATDAGCPLPADAVSSLIAAPTADRYCDKLMQVAAQITEAAARPPEESEAQTDGARLIAYIDAHFAEYDLSLEKLSAQFNLSVSYLSRLIKKLTGFNYRDYVIRLKIKRAKELLAQGVSVAATNDLIGYANISHFIKTFKKMEGVTPSVYQRSHQADAETMV